MKARIHIFCKDSVFDPQGNTVAQALQRQGFKLVEGVRVGKVLDMDIRAGSRDEAKREIQKMCDKLLINPVIESFQIEFKE